MVEFDVEKVNLPLFVTATSTLGVSVAGALGTGSAAATGVGAIAPAAFAMSVVPEASTLMLAVLPAFKGGKKVVQDVKTAADTAKAIHGTVKQVQASGFDPFGFFKAKGERALAVIQEQTFKRILKTVKPTKNYFPRKKWDQLLERFPGPEKKAINALPKFMQDTLYNLVKYLINVTGSVVSQGGEIMELFTKLLSTVNPAQLIEKRRELVKASREYSLKKSFFGSLFG